MPRVKIAKLKKKTNIPINGLMEAFNGMTEDPDNVSNSDIIFPKFVKIKRIIKDFVAVLKSIEKELISNNCYIKGLREIVNQSTDEYAVYATVNTNEIDRYILDINSAPRDVLRNLKNTYYKMCKSIHLKIIMRIGTNIKKSGVNKETSAEEYINLCKSMSTSLNLLDTIPYTLDPKYVKFHSRYTEIDDITNYMAKFQSKNMYRYLRNLYKLSSKLYNIRQTPDINTDVIHEQIVEILRTFKSDLRDKRLDRAFRIIENSEGLFNENFNKYFKVMKKSNNPASFLTEFIEDVSKNVSGDVELSDLAEIKQLAVHLKRIILKKMNGRGPSKSNERLESVLNIMDEIFDKFADTDEMDSLSEDDIKRKMDEFQNIFGVDVPVEDPSS